MKIRDVLHKESILPEIASADKKGVLGELSEPVAQLAGVSSEELVRVLLERERLGSTGIGGGIGIPHGKMQGLDELVLGFGLSRAGVAFDSMDGRPTHIFFLLVTPENSAGLHLKLLARISRVLKNDMFKARLLDAHDRDAVYCLIQEYDDEDF